jgi:hypothetical protein
VGEWFDEWREKARNGLTGPEAMGLLQAMERRLNNEIAGKVQADIDAQNGATVTGLIAAIAEARQACVVIGSLAVVKYEVGDEVHVEARTLTPAEMKALERSPFLRRQPDHFFYRLAEAAQAHEGASLSGEPPPALASGAPEP